MIADAPFWDKISEKYAKRPISNVENYENTLTRTRHYLRPDAIVLELGCGTGTTALKLAPYAGQITATDFSEGMLTVARRRQAEAGTTNVDFRRASANDQWLSQSYDAVLAFNLLHLIVDLPTTLSAIHAGLKPGGYFISKTACLREGSWTLRPLIRVMQWVGKAPFVATLGTRDIEDAICAAGFELEETKSFTKTSHFVVARKI